MTSFGIDRLLAEPELLRPLEGKRVALLAHPASVTADLTHSLDALIAAGVNVTAAVGPCIGFDAFEVGPEVLDAFASRFGGDGPMRRRGDNKGHVDLREAVRRQLVAAGVPADRIDTTGNGALRGPTRRTGSKSTNQRRTLPHRAVGAPPPRVARGL